FPLVEIHEIIHVFGLGHIYDDNKKIMYPILFRIKSCEIDSIDENTNNCLKNIYSDNKLEGNCSDLEMYPWPEENYFLDDFKWDKLPVTYSISNCVDKQKNYLQKAERILENFSGYELYEFSLDEENSQVNFYCANSTDESLLNFEADSWSESNYFVAAQPNFVFEDETIKKVKITLFSQNKECGGIELHELLHGLGLRNHYGYWMFYEESLCLDDGVIDRESISKIKEIYGLE
ncbi:hypothetical protein J4477_01465, partial [Candidatus Pacearchaeota archaeon]|nr:hypothetical protein [Candidatus Pacearchaeota archaeon]